MCALAVDASIARAFTLAALAGERRSAQGRAAELAGASDRSSPGARARPRIEGVVSERTRDRRSESTSHLFLGLFRVSAADVDVAHNALTDDHGALAVDKLLASVEGERALQYVGISQAKVFTMQSIMQKAAERSWYGRQLGRRLAYLEATHAKVSHKWLEYL